jgi:hypothetical protein
MRKWLAALLLAVCSTSQAQSEREWTDVQVGLAAVAMTLRFVDWGQTLDIAERWPTTTYSEKNPFIGPYPSRGDVNRFFIVSTVLMGAFAHYVPQYRTAILSLYIANGAYYTKKNYEIGLRINF